MELRIAALLPSETATVLDKVPSTKNSFAVCWESLRRDIEVSRPHVVVVDPTVTGRMEVEPVLLLLKDHSSLPVAAYCRLSEETFGPLLQLFGAGLADVFLYPLHHHPLQLKERMIRLATDPCAYALLRLLETRIAQLTPILQLAVFDLFSRPHRYQSGDDLARECHTSVRMLYRALESAGLSTPRRLVILAKAMRGYAYLKDDRSIVDTVSRSLGYVKRSQFSSHLKEIFGCPASAMRYETRNDRVIAAALDWMYRPTRAGRRRGSPTKSKMAVRDEPSPSSRLGLPRLRNVSK